MKHRLSMCEDCAFHKDSREMKPEIREDFLLAQLSRIFACHKTMHDKRKSKRKWWGVYDPKRDKKGRFCSTASHLMCAGYAALFADEWNIDVSKMDVRNHALKFAIPKLIRGSSMLTNDQLRDLLRWCKE